MNRIPVAIVGASGYTGQELVRLLLLHPNIQLVCATSRSEAGSRLDAIFPRFRNLPGSDLLFTEPDPKAIAATGAKFAFLALPHGVAVEYAKNLIAEGLRVIDLSADFRIHDPAVYQEFYDHPHADVELLKTSVYGLPEVHKEAIKHSQLIASPGCYPTSILLPLLPLVREKLIDPSTIHAFSMSGVSGAGKTANVRFLFAECNESVRCYGAPKHRHLSEIEQELSIAAGEKVTITFTPHLIPVTSGICTTTTATLIGDAKQIGAALERAYKSSSFVRLLGEDQFADTKHVTRTNFIDIGFTIDTRTNRVILSSAEDNLVKGAGGQAVQSFNIMNDLDETTGLLLA